MGTDIHFIVQKKNGKTWEQVTTDRTDYYAKGYPTIPGEFRWKGERNYYFFAWLADVRNGHGFAGIKTFEPVKPLTSSRGMPEDFGDHEAEYDEDGEPTKWFDLGEHSKGFATFAEILAHPRRPVMQSGFLERADYVKLLEGVKPKEWCSVIDGRGIIKCDSADFAKSPNATHVRASWIQDNDGLDEFIAAVKELADKYGGDNVRMVFGFDS